MVDDVGIDAVHSPHFASTPLILTINTPSGYCLRTHSPGCATFCGGYINAIEKVDYFYNDILNLNVNCQAAAYSDDMIWVLPSRGQQRPVHYMHLQHRRRSLHYITICNSDTRRRSSDDHFSPTPDFRLE